MVITELACVQTPPPPSPGGGGVCKQAKLSPLYQALGCKALVRIYTLAMQWRIQTIRGGWGVKKIYVFLLSGLSLV